MGLLKNKLRFRILFVLDVLFLLFVQVLQGAAVNYYFIKQFEEYFTTYFLFILDFFCLCIFAGTFVLSYSHFTREGTQKSMTGGLSKRLPNFRWGVLPMCYISWFLYASILIAKLSVIFIRLNDIRDTKDNHTHVLQICLGASSIVFMFLVEGHNWHKKSSEGYTFITDLCKKIGIEIFDSVEMFALLVTTDQMSIPMENVIFALSSINYILPTLSLYELSRSNFGKEDLRVRLPVRILHNSLKLSLIDIPFFIVRILSWLVHRDLTIFMVKNLFYIFMSVRDLYLDIFMYFRPLTKGKKTSAAEEIPLSNEQTQTDGSKSDTRV